MDIEKNKQTSAAETDKANSKVNGLLQKIKGKLSDTNKKVQDAPEPIRKRIHLVLFIILFCTVLAVLSLLVSIIPSLSYMRALTAVMVIAAVYIGMSLPRWLRVIDKHVEFVGIIDDIQERKILASTKKAIANSNARATLILTVKIKDGKYCRIEVPNMRRFSTYMKGYAYKFYYATDSDDHTFSMANFLFAKPVELKAEDVVLQSVESVDDIETHESEEAKEATNKDEAANGKKKSRLLQFVRKTDKIGVDAIKNEDAEE